MIWTWPEREEPTTDGDTKIRVSRNTACQYRIPTVNNICASVWRDALRSSHTPLTTCRSGSVSLFLHVVPCAFSDKWGNFKPIKSPINSKLVHPNIFFVLGLWTLKIGRVNNVLCLALHITLSVGYKWTWETHVHNWPHDNSLVAVRSRWNPERKMTKAETMKPTNAGWVEVDNMLPLWQSEQVQPERLN